MKRRSFIKAAIALVASALAGPKARAMPRVVMQKDLLDQRFVHASPVYAQEGEWIVCERGHSIARFNRAVNYGDPFDPSVISDWQQPEPKVGDIGVKCAKCGAEFNGAAQFHFENGWRV